MHHINLYIVVFLMTLLSSLRMSAQDLRSDFTVIFCGMPERVEPYVLEEFASILRMRENGEIGTNLSLAGLLKFGENSCGISWQKELQPYGYDGTLYIDLGTKNGHEIPPIDGDTIHASTTYLKELKARKYADKNFQFFNTDSLAYLIKTVAKSHPARNYVLCLLGHGNGQYCMRDDYYPGRRGITADELESAIKKSGVKLHTLFFHNCLMGTLENLAVYQHCARYATLSPEETCGGYIQHFLSNLSKAGSNPDKFTELMRETIDFYAKTADRDDEIDTSLGFYDLSKVKKVLSTVKNISAWYEETAMTDSMLVDAAVRSAILSCGPDSAVMANPDTCLAEVDSKLILSHLMHQTISLSKTMPTASNIPLLESLYEKYMQQLKEMAYIKCNHTKDTTADYNYLYASPSISVYSVDNKDCSNFKSSQFDKLTHWSRFLRRLRVNPSYHTNQSRTVFIKSQ